MTTAVYVLSPHDKIENFASKARRDAYENSAVYIGGLKDEVRSVVFVDGSPAELKRKIAHGEDLRKELHDYKDRLSDLLKYVRVGQDDLAAFVHFGGQGEEEVKKFNGILAAATSETDTFKCYAISVGNKIPQELFPDGEFSPPYGEAFKSMCVSLQKGEMANFEHLRALRIMLSLVRYKENGSFILGGISELVRLACGGKYLGGVLTGDERARLLSNKNLLNVLNLNGNNSSVRLPASLSCEEYVDLTSNLLKKGTVL